MQPNKHQLELINWLKENNNTNAIATAVAGSGKSTTLKLAIAELEKHRIPPNFVKLVVYNRKNVDELKTKFTYRWQQSITTLHSLGYGILRDCLDVNANQIDRDINKYRAIAINLGILTNKQPNEEKLGILLKEKIVTKEEAFLKLADLVRLTLTPCDSQKLKEVAGHYHLESIEDFEAISIYLQQLFLAGSQQAIEHKIIDYTDMLWLPVYWRLDRHPHYKLQRHDYLFVDECQDLNKLQLELVLMLCHQTTKLLFVGDKNQSIYGFSGSDVDSVDNIIARTSPEQFTLPVCYRCPKSHIRVINKLFPEIPIQAAEAAIEGEISTIDLHELWSDGKASPLREGDLILARKTSSLINLAVSLIGRGIGCCVLGKDLGAGLIDELNNCAESPGFNYSELPKYLDIYRNFKLKIYKQKKDGTALAVILEDKLKAIECVFENSPDVTSVEQLAAKIIRLFSETSSPITLSTAHRAKGAEAERVFILKPEDFPLVWENQSDWEYQQEENLLYVALSRAKSQLFLIGSANWYENVSDIKLPIETQKKTLETDQLSELERLQTAIDTLDYKDLKQLEAAISEKIKKIEIDTIVKSYSLEQS
jgi:superfamily I DNA/RNA helicase